MKHEDILRELELLPVWKLRTPKHEALPVMQGDPTLVKLEEDAPLSSLLPAAAVPAASKWLALLSDDRNYLFVLEQGLSADAEALLQNMLRAITVTPQARMEASLPEIFSECTFKLLIALGETVAQAVLGTNIPLQQLRGKVHQFQDSSLIATYSPTHLLNHGLDKAKAWQDFCLASATLQALPGESSEASA